MIKIGKIMKDTVMYLLAEILTTVMNLKIIHVIGIHKKETVFKAVS
jgi:hypothetical protein